MSIEAMKQALEALESATPKYTRQRADQKTLGGALDYWKLEQHQRLKAITSLRQAIADAEKQEPVAMQMDVIVGNLIRDGINKHRARELAEHFIKHAQPKQDQGGPVACPLGLDTQDANQLCSAGYCDKCKQPSVAIPSVEFEKVADGIEIGYDFLGGVDIRLGGEFVYVHINYDYRYTHNAARKALAEQIVGLFTHPQPKREPPTPREVKDTLPATGLLTNSQAWDVAEEVMKLLAAHGIKE